MSSWGLRDNLLQIFFWETLANLNEKSFVGFVAQYMSEVKRSIHHSWVSLTFARKQQRKSFSSLIRLSYLKIIEPGFSRVYSAKMSSFSYKYNHIPAHRSFPSAMMAIRSPSRSASSMKWVERRIEHLLLYCWITSQMARRAAGSIPDVGSSRITYYRKI